MNYSRFILTQWIVFLSLLVWNPCSVRAAADAGKSHNESILVSLVTEKVFSIVLEHARYKSNYAQMFHEGRSSVQRSDESDVVLTIALQLAENIIRSSNYVRTINKLIYIRIGRNEHNLKAEVTELVFDWISSDQKDISNSIRQHLDHLMPENLGNTSEDRDFLIADILETLGNGGEVERVDANIALLQKESVTEHLKYECSACFDKFSIKYLSALNCGHYLCLECMAQHIKAKIDEEIIDVCCPLKIEKDCTHRVSHAEILRLCSKPTIRKYEVLNSELFIKSQKNLFHCINPEGCNALLTTDDEAPTRLRCYACNYIFCFNCKDEWHDGYSCDQYQEWKVENNEAEGKFREWSNKNTKQCPSCETNIEKNEGCFKMTCENCMHTFCWKCLQAWTEYQHITRKTLDNGQANPCYDGEYFGR